MKTEARIVNDECYQFVIHKNGQEVIMNADAKKADAREYGTIYDFDFIPNIYKSSLVNDIDFDEFVKYAALIKNRNNGAYLFDYYGADLNALKEAYGRIDTCIYTVVEELGRQYVLTGYHRINRYGYLVGKKLLDNGNYNIIF